MRKRIISILLFVQLLVLVGCGNAGGKDYMDLKNGDATDQAVYNFHKLMDADKTGDGKSVTWDGIEAKVIDDELDAKGIDDGRSYANGYVPLQKEHWSTNIYRLEDYETVIDTEDHVLYKGKDWQFEVKALDSYDDNVQKLKEEKWVSFLGESDKVERTSYFRAVREVDGKNYAGFIVCYDDHFGPRYYEYSYMGLGNMADIEAIMNQIRAQFSVKMD